MFTPLSRESSPMGMSSAREAVIACMGKVLDPVVATGCILRPMTINLEFRTTNVRRQQRLMAAGGLVGALAASSCCILPLVLFSLGVSGAWIGNFTRLAPYQPYFLAVTIGCLGYGYWLVFRSAKFACADGDACARR